VLDPPSSAAVTPLEGVSGGGDSGAPAYVFANGEPQLVGVGSRSSDTNRDGIEQNYGDTDLYVNVPSYRRWIDRVIAGRENALSRWTMRHDQELLLASLCGGFLIAGAAVLSLGRRRRESRPDASARA
jgi:hypothetical protein